VLPEAVADAIGDAFGDSSDGKARGAVEFGAFGCVLCRKSVQQRRQLGEVSEIRGIHVRYAKSNKGICTRRQTKRAKAIAVELIAELAWMESVVWKYAKQDNTHPPKKRLMKLSLRVSGLLFAALISLQAQTPSLVPAPLWEQTQTLPKSAELTSVQGAEFHVIKKQRPDTDECKFTLGVGLAWHKDRLYASYAFNKGDENTPTEEAHIRVSADAGRTWGAPVVMDNGEGNLGVSHGVFLSHSGRLWAFMGAFYDKFERTHTRAYTLNETSGSWEPHGVIIDGGFWPMQEPQKMADGNWIMAGIEVSDSSYLGQTRKTNLPAVAISHGEDFTRWDLVVIPAAPDLGGIWGESTVIVDGKRILNISRYGAKSRALVAASEDNGRTWTPSAPSNLAMATSKPYAGILSTGQRYLVCTTTADTGARRSPLTIAVSRPGESKLSRVFLIRPSVCGGTPGVSAPNADFSYPYAVEHGGKLYIGYTHKSHGANELAVIPIRSLSVQP
jgi:hypothetical protein